MNTLDPSLKQALFPDGGALSSRAKWISNWTGAAVDLIFPPHCCSCFAPLAPGINKAICRSCAERVNWIGADRCDRCGDAVGRGSGVVPECPSCRTHPPAYIRASCAVAQYAAGPLRDLVLGLKFGRKNHLAYALGELLAQRLQQTGLALPHSIIVPAPLSHRTERERGFNQAAELAHCVGKRLRLPVETQLLVKNRTTPTQATLTHEQRRVNLKGAFDCQPRLAERYRGRGILLIDDVMTTGSTLSECARTLMAGGVGEIRAGVIARG